MEFPEYPFGWNIVAVGNQTTTVDNFSRNYTVNGQHPVSYPEDPVHKKAAATYAEALRKKQESIIREMTKDSVNISGPGEMAISDRALLENIANDIARFAHIVNIAEMLGERVDTLNVEVDFLKMRLEKMRKKNVSNKRT